MGVGFFKGKHNVPSMYLFRSGQAKVFLSNANGLSVVRDSRILSVVRDSKMENNPECFRPLPGRLPAKVLGILDCSQQGSASIKISVQQQIWILFLSLNSLISMEEN